MYDDRDRPPWLRKLRPPRAEPEPETLQMGEPADEPGSEATDEDTASRRGSMTRRQLLVLALLLWGNVSILGCLCLLATQIVQP